MAFWRQWLEPDSTSYVAVKADHDLEFRGKKRILSLSLEIRDDGCGNAVCVSFLPTGEAEDIPRALESIGVLHEAVLRLEREALEMLEENGGENECW